MYAVAIDSQRKVRRMKVVLGIIVGVVIGFLAMTYFKTGHLPF